MRTSSIPAGATVEGSIRGAGDLVLMAQGRVGAVVTEEEDERVVGDSEFFQMVE